MSAPVKVLRIYADESGQSLFDTVEIARDMATFAPPAKPFPVSKPAPATRYVVLQLPVGWSGEKHPSPARQILFCLSGSVRVSPGLGEPAVVGPGDAWLMEDTTGSGHVTEVTSQVPFEAVVVQLPD